MNRIYARAPQVDIAVSASPASRGADVCLRIGGNTWFMRPGDALALSNQLTDSVEEIETRNR